MDSPAGKGKGRSRRLSKGAQWQREQDARRSAPAMALPPPVLMVHTRPQTSPERKCTRNPPFACGVYSVYFDRVLVITGESSARGEERWARPLTGTTLSSMPTTLPKHGAAVEQPPPPVTGMDVLKAARGGTPSSSSSSIQLTPPRPPPITVGHSARGSFSGSTTWEADLDRGSFFDSYASIPAGSTGGGEMATPQGVLHARVDSSGFGWVRAEVSMSSLLSQSSRKFAQTHRARQTNHGATSTAVAVARSVAALASETSQSSFARMRKRGGVAARGSDHGMMRKSFGGGFSGPQTLRNAGGQRTLGVMHPYASPRGRPPLGDHDI